MQASRQACLAARSIPHYTWPRGYLAAIPAQTGLW
jgi:hypothetical protein